MTTTRGMSERYQKSRSTILAAIRRLGIEKDGRDFLLTEEQEKEVVGEIRARRGHPTAFSMAKRRLLPLYGKSPELLEFCLARCEKSKKEARWFISAALSEIENLIQKERNLF